MSGNVCDKCGQSVHENPPRPIDMIDQLYLAFGKCCAGCDYWQHNPAYTRPLGYCQKRHTGTIKAFDTVCPGSVRHIDQFERTEAKFVCSDFQDTFDWTTLDIKQPLWLTPPTHTEEGKP